MDDAEKKPTYAIYCGQVRKPEYVIKAAAVAKECLARGILDDAFIVTWTNEIKKYGALKEVIEDAGISIVEIDFRDDAYSPNNTFHQLTQMRVGLDLCPKNSFVFKSRLDMAFNTSMSVCDHLDRLKKSDLSIGAKFDNFPFEKRMWVGKIGSIDAPFWLNDRFIFAERGDMEKILGFSMEYEFLMHYMGAFNEVRWFANPFFRRFPIVQNIFRLNWLGPIFLIASGRIKRREMLDFLSTFRFYWKSLAISYLIIQQGFRIGVENFSRADYDDLRTPMRTDGDELPDTACTVEERYAEFLADPRFQDALAVVGEERFHETYDLMNDPDFVDMAEGWKRISEFPFPEIEIYRPTIKKGLPASFYVEDYYDNPEKYSSGQQGTGPQAITEFFNPEFISNIKLIVHGGKKVAVGEKFVVDVLIINGNGVTIPLNPGGHPLLVSPRWIDAEGNSLGVHWPRHQLIQEIRKYYRYSFHQDAPSSPGAYRLVVDLLVEEVLWFGIEASIEVVVEPNMV